MKTRLYLFRSAIFLAAVLLWSSTNAHAADTLIAVAANFKAPAEEIATAFHAANGGTVKMSYGPSGEFYTQISHGAPFEIFLSADADRPKKADTDGLSVPGTRFTYAIGKLVLWSKDPKLVDADGKVLKTGSFAKISIADPKLAPYGAAAVETMQKLDVWTVLQPKIVQGNSIGQAQQFVASGNAQLGFVALSQIIKDQSGSRWIVPEALHSPIEQQAVLLKAGSSDAVARAYLTFLKGPVATAIIRKYGYELP